VRVLDDVAHDPQFGFAQLDVAGNGTLAYLRSPGSGLATIRWLDGGGATRPIVDEPARYQWPKPSADGRRLAYGLLEATDPDLWTLDLATGAKERVTGAGNQNAPIWSADSRFLFYSESPNAGIVWQRADASGTPQPLLPGSAAAWSLSPAGSRLAYCSNDTGTREVYVRAVPDDGSRVRVSANGGCIAAWSTSGARLYYETGDRRLLALDYRVEGAVFVPDNAAVWSDVLLADTGVLANFDVAPGDAGIVALVAADAAEQRPRDHVTLVLEFFDEIASRTMRAGDPR
jgi:hypothetical protein